MPVARDGRVRDEKHDTGRETSLVHQPTQKTQRVVLLPFVALACGLLTACGSSTTSGSVSVASGVASSMEPGGVTAATGSCGIFPEFSLSTDYPNPRGATPQLGISAFLASGSAAPGVSAATAGYPRTGWRPVKLDTNRATFQASYQSGTAELDVTQVHAGSWVVTGGRKNC